MARSHRLRVGASGHAECQKLLAEAGEAFLRQGHNLADLPIVNVYLAREKARRGDRDDAIGLMHAAVDHHFRNYWPMAFQRPVLTRRHCSTAGPTLTWLKPRPRSNG